MLHDVLRRHPALVPATDLGFGRMVTVGYETQLTSGAADLLLMDDTGRLCLVEVNKEKNTDTRRVIAQLTDYAAALWGMTLGEFERDVFRPRRPADDPRSLREFAVDELLRDRDDVEEAADQLLDRLSETLRSGDFALVVAAPTIPEGVERVMEYLNARGLTLYGLEVSYFAGEIEAFVPRIVVRPTVGTRIAGRDSQAASKTAVDPETYLAELPEAAVDPVSEFLAHAPGLGAELEWVHYGPRVRVHGPAGPRVVAAIEGENAYLKTGPLQGIDPGPAARGARTATEHSWGERQARRDLSQPQHQ